MREDKIPADPPNSKGKSRLRAVAPDEATDSTGAIGGWQSGLKRNKGRVTKSIANLELLLTEHDAWRGILVHDAFAGRTLAVKTDDGRVPPCTETGHWRDVDTTRVRIWLAQQYGIEAGAETLDSVIESVAHRQQRHPVREFLDALRWDGVQRLPTFLTQYFGCPDTPYYAEIGKMWMISGVARVRKPGCQADYVLVLVSPEQGLRKSTAIRLLGKGWGADTSVRIGDKDALLALQGVWVLELAELSSLRGAQDIEAVKAFTTSRVDHFRAPFARRVQDWPRQCIFAGSTNEHECLADPTGNRRFWPADCGQIDTEGLAAIVDQLWAEADARYQSGEPWYPTTQELHDQLREEQDDHTQEDGWLSQVQTWLADPQRVIRLGQDDFLRVDLSGGVTTSEVLRGALGAQPDRCTRAYATHMGHILRQCGMVCRKVQINGNRSRRYFMPLEKCPERTTQCNLPNSRLHTQKNEQLQLSVQCGQPDPQVINTDNYNDGRPGGGNVDEIDKCVAPVNKTVAQLPRLATNDKSSQKQLLFDDSDSGEGLAKSGGEDGSDDGPSPFSDWLDGLE